MPLIPGIPRLRLSRGILLPTSSIRSVSGTRLSIQPKEESKHELTSVDWRYLVVVNVHGQASPSAVSPRDLPTSGACHFNLAVESDE
jgi:hypothetical protein